MKVIFLDVEGVLNTRETFYNLYMNWNNNIGVKRDKIDDFRVAFLKKIVDETDAKIVLNSSWNERYQRSDNKLVPIYESSKLLEKQFNKYGLNVYDIIPECDNSYREKEINIWLEHHQNIESFIVLDDDKKELGSFVGKQLIETNFGVKDDMSCSGLCEEHIDRAISILNDKKVLKLTKKS